MEVSVESCKYWSNTLTNHQTLSRMVLSTYTKPSAINIHTRKTRAGPRFCEAQGGGCMRGPLLPSVSSSPLCFLSLPLPLNAARGFGGAVSSPNAPAEIKFGAFYRYNMTLGGSNFTNFPQKVVWV